MVVFNAAGYDVPRMAHLLRGLPAEVLGRMRRPGRSGVNDMNHPTSHKAKTKGT